MVIEFRNIKGGTPVQRQPRGIDKPRRGPGPVRAARSAGQTCQRGNNPGRSNAAQSVKGGIRDIDLPRRPIHRDAYGIAKLRRRARAIRAAKAASRQSGNHSPRRHLANPPVTAIRHIKRAVRADRNPPWQGKPRCTARTLRISLISRQPGQRAHHPRRCDLTDRVIAPVGYIEISHSINGDPLGLIKTRSRAWTILRACAPRRAREELPRINLPPHRQGARPN